MPAERQHAAIRAAWAIALGPDSAVLAVPWLDETGKSVYVDLRACPGCIQQIPEARENPPLARVLELLNAPESPWTTAKCDLWPLDEDDLEAASFDLALSRDPGFAQAGIGSYIDFYHRDAESFASLDYHRELLPRLTRAAETLPSEPAAMLEMVLRHSVVHGREGYAITAFLYAIGEDAAQAQTNWAGALETLTHILLGGAARGDRMENAGE